MTMRSEDPLDPSPPTLAARWRQTRLDVEAGRPSTYALTPAQIAAVKSSIGFSCGNEGKNYSYSLALSRGLGVPKLCILPLSSGKSVGPGEIEPLSARIDNGWSGSDTWFPERAIFSHETLDSFAIEEVSLRPWKEAPIGLLHRERDGRIDVALLNAFLCRVALPAYDDLALVVRNVDDAPRVFSCAILYYQRAAEMPREEARWIDEFLWRCANGTRSRVIRAAESLRSPE